MKPKFLLIAIVAVLGAVAFSSFQKDRQKEPWSDDQLMAPAALAEKINSGKMGNTVIFDIGPSGQIKNAIDIGPAQDAENLAKLKHKLEKLPKNTEVVIYCGCCPFKHCPNVRPAFELLNEMKFANARLLNLSRNLKADWIDKGYPMHD